MEKTEKATKTQNFVLYDKKVLFFAMTRQPPTINSFQNIAQKRLFTLPFDN